MVTGVALIVVGNQLTHSSGERATVLTAGLLGLVTYLLVNGVSRAFRPPDVESVTTRTAVGKAGLTLACYSLLRGAK